MASKARHFEPVARSSPNQRIRFVEVRDLQVFRVPLQPFAWEAVRDDSQQQGLGERAAVGEGRGRFAVAHAGVDPFVVVVSRFEVEGIRSAGAVSLTDDGLKRREVLDVGDEPRHLQRKASLAEPG